MGGMRLGLAGVREGSSITSFDTSPVSNAVYRENFADPIQERLVEHIKLDELDGAADLWLLSPPCQPFTKTTNANRKDSADNRCAGFLFLADMLKRLTRPPRWIFCENVFGFLGSEMHRVWARALGDMGYTSRTWLLSPRQLGIPNNRLRVYMASERSGRFASEEGCVASLRVPEKVAPIAEFVDPECNGMADLYIREEVLAKPWAKGLSICGLRDTTSHCFTKGYGKVMHRSSGSLLLCDADRSLLEHPIDKSNMVEYQGHLRLFAPRELLNLMAFPSSFRFPASMSLKHCYRVIGNSINVKCVTFVLADLLAREGDEANIITVAEEEVLEKGWRPQGIGADAAGEEEGDEVGEEQ
eukprot:Sspe_Gene.110995::Locus_92162_Transcript_1_1_Confidence_1.000_Length_1158::g.110995::m.110995/K15336/TRDMT1, DNMT2; tRNA (cytosine38-C5)-methyltransferase